jgi:outer membrane protein assembly factor BamB
MNARWLLVGAALGLSALLAGADDWPQWRGPNRDAKVTGFKAPATWPKELTKKWKIDVGNGDATPALVGDKLYVFTFNKAEGNEVLRCLEAAGGKELWQEKYPTQGATNPAAGPHEGPRSSPTVADGKVVTLGVRGILSCFDATTGKRLWHKDDFKGSWPRFYTSSSPIVVDGLCVAQLGSESKGGIVAYELATGNEKWRWTDDGTAYASPVLMTLDGAKVLVAETANNIVGLGLDGKVRWQTPFAGKGGQSYNAATPIVAGNTVIFSGTNRGTRAVTIEKQGDKYTAKEVWTNPENSVQFNTPVLKGGLVFGITGRDELFCIGKDGKTAWTTPTKAKGGRPGFGSVVDAGPVLVALTPASQLIVYEPGDKEFKELARYKVADKATYAYPILAGNRVYIKDEDSLTLWTIE